MAETIKDINGGANDYPTLVLWEDARNGDIRAGNAEVARVKGSIEESGNLNLCTISGWATDADSYWAIRVDEADRISTSPLRFGGGIYLLQNRSTGGKNVISVSSGSEYGKLQGLQMATDAASGAASVLNLALSFSTTIGNITIEDCIICHVDNQSTGIYLAGGNGYQIDYQIWDTVIYNCTTGVYSYRYSFTCDIYNCTVYNCSTDGISQITQSPTCYNTIVYASGNNDFNGSVNGDYNMSEDATAPGANSLDSGTGGNDPSFVSTTGGSEDFTIASDSDAIDAGTDDPSSGLYSDDIFGTARSTYDMGAHEYVAAGGGIAMPIVMLQHDHFNGGAIL